jgi:hypothetical protein
VEISILFFSWALLFACRPQINPILPCYALPCPSQIKGQKDYQKGKLTGETMLGKLAGRRGFFPVFCPKVGT